MADIIEEESSARLEHDDMTSDWDDFGDVSLALQRFMTRLLDDARVSALHTFLIQDNASILTKAASRSAHAAHRRFLLGKDHLITKEISRWESYPFEVDKPIVVSRPKKAKNGCVPQRKARRRSGLESAGEIKADILKKAESLPRPPRRRSSVRTDDVLASFGDNTKFNNEKPKRELSPHRLATPKKPVRRESAVPLDMYLNPQAANNISGRDSLSIGGDSQHSSASESTLSELGGRISDLSSIGDNSDMLSALDTRSLDCDFIMEEDDEDEEDLIGGPLAQPQRGFLVPNNSSQSLPKKPMRRVSEFPEHFGNPDNKLSLGTPIPQDEDSVLFLSKDDAEATLVKPDQVPPLSTPCDPIGTGSAPVTMPKKPMRRTSETPQDLIPDRKSHSAKHGDMKADETQYSPGTDSTVSDTTQDTIEDLRSTIRKEGSNVSLNESTELPPLQDHSGTEAFYESVCSESASTIRTRGSGVSLNEESSQDFPPLNDMSDALPESGQ